MSNHDAKPKADGAESLSTAGLGAKRQDIVKRIWSRCLGKNDKLSNLAKEAADEVLKLRAKAARWEAIETLMILGDVELTQTEDGGYCIAVEPVENILATAWAGDTPEQAADKVLAQLTTPNVKFRPTHAASSREVAPGTQG